MMKITAYGNFTLIVFLIVVIAALILWLAVKTKQWDNMLTLFRDGWLIIKASKNDRIPKFTLDDHGMIIYMNDRVKSFFGYTKDELMKKHISTLVHKKDIDRFNTYKRRDNSEVVDDDEGGLIVQAQRKNTTTFTAEVFINKWRSETDSDTFYYNVSFTNIQHRVDNAETRRRLENYINRISSLCSIGEEIANMGSWAWYLVDDGEIKAGTVLGTPNFCKIFRLRPAEPITAIMLMDLIFEDDKERVKAEMAKPVLIDQDYSVIYHLPRLNGRFDRVLCIGRREKNANGVLVKINGIVRVLEENITIS